MITVVMSSVPPSLRGFLSHWMYELSATTFVGTPSARIRDILWKKITEECGFRGSAWMAFPDPSNAQKITFRSYNTTWKAIDFDGIVLPTRPLKTPRSHDPPLG